MNRASDVVALGGALAAGNPAPFAAVVRVPSVGCHVASASEFLAKDRAENVMIVDVVRNDLGRVCEWGSVTVPALCPVEAHPGLVHLVSTVRGRLREGVGWAELIKATFPPGSISEAPTLAALKVIARLEPVPHGVYCGAVGRVDADRRRGDLNVAIRTFWVDDLMLLFGRGGAITWDSTPAGEWAETELKARRLLGVASSADRLVGVRT